MVRFVSGMMCLFGKIRMAAGNNCVCVFSFPFSLF